MPVIRESVNARRARTMIEAVEAVTFFVVEIGKG